MEEENVSRIGFSYRKPVNGATLPFVVVDIPHLKIAYAETGYLEVNSEDVWQAVSAWIDLLGIPRSVSTTPVISFKAVS